MEQLITEYEYNGAGWLVKETRTQGAESKVTEYEYDSDGRITKTIEYKEYL